MSQPSPRRSSSPSHAPLPVPRNAFNVLMSAPQPTSRTKKKPPTSIYNASDRKDALYPYIYSPESYGPAEMIYYNDSFALIRDGFPKAVVHLLLLPRSLEKTVLRPLDAFQDAEFLAQTRAEADKAVKLVASELKRRFGEQNGRDWRKEVRVGVHAGPSMNHLHVHIITRDNWSDRMKSAKHYRTFNTDFFVELDEFPLPDVKMRDGERSRQLKEDMRCWRCGENWGNKWASLKRHLDVEYEGWKNEGVGKEKVEEEAKEGKREVKAAGMNEEEGFGSGEE